VRKELIYCPQPNATPDEVLQVLKVFTYSTLPEHMRTDEVLQSIYKSLPENAQRHFKVKEENI
jgi:hypothetical protein